MLSFFGHEMARAHDWMIRTQRKPVEPNVQPNRSMFNPSMFNPSTETSGNQWKPVETSGNQWKPVDTNVSPLRSRLLCVMDGHLDGVRAPEAVQAHRLEIHKTRRGTTRLFWETQLKTQQRLHSTWQNRNEAIINVKISTDKDTFAWAFPGNLCSPA